jgi:hypothetical protein
MESWLSIARRRHVVVRAARTSLLVGTILVLINQGSIILLGDWTGALIGKMILTYLVPYAVSTHAGVAAIRDNQVNPTIQP